MLTTALYFIVVVGVIVFVHEFGHFIAAKLSGVRVEVFSLGFPPRLWSRKWGETEYQLAWIPLGGFVRMSGMVDESVDETVDLNDPRGFNKQSFIKKVFIITAGVMMNMILGLVIYSVITFSAGVGKMTGTTLTMVSEDYPAFTAGLREGDKVIAIGGKEVASWDELTNIVRVNAGREIEIKWKRSDSTYSAVLSPKAVPEFDVETASVDTVGKIGVMGTMVTEAVGPLDAIYYGGKQVWTVFHLNIISLKALITQRARISELTGPLGIAKMSRDSARSGIVNFIAFLGMISVSIGFLNILPIPMLDGGHLLFIVIEAVIRREIPEKVKVVALKVGMAALLLLVLVVSYHDIIRFYTGGN